MNVTLLDKNLREHLVVDCYESFIWTERYNTNGDMEMVLPIGNDYVSRKILERDSTTGNLVLLDGYASIRGSKNLMFLEQFKIDVDEESGTVLTIVGRSLESILMRRIIWGLKVFTCGFQYGIKKILKDNIISPTDSDRQIPNFIFSDSEDTDIINKRIRAQYTGDSVYDVISSLCQKEKIGFKINVNDFDQFVFSLYKGTDRSYEQNVNNFVVFSPSFDNLRNSNYLESTGYLKNVTLVGGDGEGKDRKFKTVGSASGLDRREIFTDARDVSSNSGDYILLTSQPSNWSTNYSDYYINTGTNDNPSYEQIESDSVPTWQTNVYYKYDEDATISESEYNAQLTQRGEKTLKENKFIGLLDGNVDPSTKYIYGRDFFLGDIVQVDDGLGHSERLRVSEYIISVGQEGLSAYPSFVSIDEDEENED